MGVTDFLFQGKPPPSVNTYGSTTSSVPQWLSDTVQGTLAKANAVAGQPYQAYKSADGTPLPRIAAPNQNMTQGWASSIQGAGAYKPAFDQASGQYGEAAQGSAMGAASPYLTQAAGQWGQGAMDQYMSPYISGVTDRIAQLGARNLSENLMPAIGDDFTRAGQLGSSRMQMETGKALRDTQESVLAQQTNALNQGYTNAQSAFNNDQNRIANVGQVMGNMSSIDTNNNLATGNALTKFGQANQSAGILAGSTQAAVGNEQRGIDQQNLDLAHQDFLDQKNYPLDMVKFLSGVENGIPSVGGTTYTSKNAPLEGAQYQPSGLASIAGTLALSQGLSNLKLKRGGPVKRPSKSDPIVLEGEILPPPKKASYRRMGV